MIEDAPIRIEGREWERGLWWMVLASGAVHALLIALALLAPLSFIGRRAAPVSYTVELIAPDRVGGTNIVPGGKGRTTAPPLVAAEAPAAAVPPAPKVDPPRAPEPKPEPAKAEPAKPAPQQVAAKPQPKPPSPKAEEPKPQPKPKEPEPQPKAAEPKPHPNDMVVKDKAKKPEPQPSPPAAKPAASPQAVAKAEAAKAPSPKVAAQSPSASPQKDTQPKSAEQKKAGPVDAKPVAARSDLDTRIAAAIKRVEQQAGVRGGGLGSKPGAQPGGPIAVGPGEGVGGAVTGFEYLLYLNQLQARLKQNWAWAGADRNRKAVVRFGILETGEIVDVRITKASGDRSYDASVERAVRAANPMPPPPEAYRKQFSDVEYTFTPESMEM